VRTVYLGTAHFAAGVLRHLVAAGTVPQLIVTRPDRPAGRGRKLTAPPVADVARELGIALAQPDDVNDAAGCQLIAEVEPEALLVCAYGALIREPLLSSYEILNVHPSLLPRWRGAAPIERAIIAGDEETGVSIMRLVEGLDCGPVCAQIIEPIAADDSFGTLSERLELRSAELLSDLLVSPRPFVEQDESAVTYAEKITATDRILNSASSAAEQERVIRALAPHIGARVELEDGLMLGIRSAHLDQGRLVYDEVVPPGSRAMSWKEFQRGRGE
jgi:methionyl-tRNA formyltransferase